MSRSVNKVTLLGNVGAEPEVRTTASGIKVAKLTLATNYERKDRAGNKVEDTQWHRLTFWDRLAEIVEQYAHKGDKMYVEGRIEYSKVDDDHGTTRYFTDIVVREIVMLGGKGGADVHASADDAPARGRSSAPAGASPFEDDDDLPF